ncbi:MAG: transposase [Candidatus Cloacimonetes bacterium]|nr:transposase [Candidatus Cloacimonadota bacterium]
MISFSGVNNLFLFFNIESTLERASITKSKGIQNVLILLYLCLLHFKGRRSITEGLLFLEKQVHKSTVHNFLNNETYNWRKLLTHTAKLYQKRFPADVGKPTIFVIDDTSKEKTGRFVEFIGKFRDHCKGCFYMGYQVIFGGISNGRTCIPIDFTIKISNPKKSNKSKKKNKKNPNRWSQAKYGKGQYLKNSHTYKRVKEAKKTKFDLCVTMLKRALKNGFKFDFVAWDSWYNCSNSFKFVFEKLVSRGIHLVAMIKLDTTKYQHNGERLNARELFTKDPKWEKITDNNIRVKSIVVDIEDKSIRKGKVLTGKVKLCFYKFPGYKDYKAIICTNIDLSAEEILELYAYRWQIEVMIKDLKQYFGFYRSMSTKYAPQVADLSINCMFYVMICTLKERKPKKSSYQILLDLQFEFEEYCYEMFFAYKFKTRTVEFVDFAMRKGLTYISELRALMNELLYEFLSKEFYDDKIIEVDTMQNDTVA